MHVPVMMHSHDDVVHDDDNDTHDMMMIFVMKQISSDDKNGQERQPTKSPAVTPAPVPPEAAIASTVVSPRVNTTDCPAFKVADTLSVATEALCRCTRLKL